MTRPLLQQDALPPTNTIYQYGLEEGQQQQGENRSSRAVVARLQARLAGVYSLRLSLFEVQKGDGGGDAGSEQESSFVIGREEEVEGGMGRRKPSGVVAAAAGADGD